MNKCTLYAMEMINCNGIREDMATLYAELTTRGIQIPDNINHIDIPYGNRRAKCKESLILGRHKSENYTEHHLVHNPLELDRKM